MGSFSGALDAAAAQFFIPSALRRYIILKRPSSRQLWYQPDGLKRRNDILESVGLWESERGAKHSCFLTMCRSDRSSFLSLTQEVVTPKVLHMCRGHRSGPHIMLF